MTRYRVWLVAAVAGALLMGLATVALPSARSGASGPSTAPDPEPGRQQAVTALLDRRAEALRHRDLTAFLATVDPRADAAFTTAQRALFDNLADVPLDSWSYRLHPDDTIDVSGDLPGVPAADERWAPGVDLDYALRGADRAPTSRTLGYLFTRRGHDWYLASDTALDAKGRPTWRGPWDFGPCQVLTTRSGLVIGHPGGEGTMHRVQAELDAAVDAVSAVWGDNWSREVAVIVPATAAEMQAQVGPAFAVDAIAGVAIADRVDNAAHTAVGQRIVLSPTAAVGLSVVALRVLLRHELTHVAARGDTVDGAPLWLLEGFADYVGYRDSGLTLPKAAPDLANQVRAGTLPDALPGDVDFHSGASRIDLSYQLAWSLTSYLGQQLGDRGLVSLYRRVAGEGHVSDDQLDQALRDVLGTDRAGLLAGWRHYLRDAAG